MDPAAKRIGSGFYQVETAYLKSPDEKVNISELRQHASKMKEVGAQLLRERNTYPGLEAGGNPSELIPASSVYPSRQAGVANPNPMAVAANRNNKIYNPTRGGTAVQFLGNSTDKATLETFELCRNIQNSLADEFGSTTAEEYKENAEMVKGASIITIENLHVTALAMGVVDAKDQQEFETRLELNDIYRACFEYLEKNVDINTIQLNHPNNPEVGPEQFLALVGASTNPAQLLENTFPSELSTAIKQIMGEKKAVQSEKLVSFLESGGAVFNVSELKVTDNGSIVLQLAANADLVQAKQGLVPLGGIAKASLGNMTASTLGYIPNFDKISSEEKEAMGKIIQDFNNQIRQKGYTIRMNNLELVNFKINTLAPSVIQTAPIGAQNHLGDMNFTYLD